MPKSALLGIVLATLFVTAPAAARAQGGDDCTVREQRAGLCEPQQGSDPSQEDVDRCAPVRSGEQGGEGNGRVTEGGSGTGKVSHKGWPPITGVLWKVLEQRGTHSHDG